MKVYFKPTSLLIVPTTRFFNQRERCGKKGYILFVVRSWILIRLPALCLVVVQVSSTSGWGSRGTHVFCMFHLSMWTKENIGSFASWNCHLIANVSFSDAWNRNEPVRVLSGFFSIKCCKWHPIYLTIAFRKIREETMEVHSVHNSLSFFAEKPLTTNKPVTSGEA